MRQWVQGHMQRGDSIVEVIIAIAVASFVLVTAYAATNRFRLTIVDSQEHREALAVAASQVEWLQYHGELDVGSKGCFNQTGESAGRGTGGCSYTSGGADSCSEAARGKCYVADITKDDETYIVKVTWRTLTNSDGTVHIFYRPPSSAVSTGVAVVPPTPPPTPPSPTCAAVHITTADFPPGPTTAYHLTDTQTQYSVLLPALSGIQPGCSYNIKLQAQDPTHPNGGPEYQFHEQIAACFFTSGIQLFCTGLTDDFPDTVKFSDVKDMGNFTFISTPDTLVFKNYAGLTGMTGDSSVEPSQIILTPL